MGFGAEEAGFDDLYVLTVPSFTWIKIYPLDSNGTGDWPHHSLSCNVISGSQMLIIGGTFPKHNICDSETVWGVHNLQMSKQNQNKAFWAAFDSNSTSYTVPEEIIA